MNAPVRRHEFFAHEAGECLERLSLLVTGAGAPDPEELVRSARILRGAALLSGPPGYAAAAAALENLAKAVRDGALPWTPLIADRAALALDTCKALLRTVREWSDADAQHCERLAEELDGLVGAGAARAPVRPGGAALTPGVRAYVAREAAALGATLEQVAEEVERRPAPNSARPLMRRLQPLRGLGALPGLSPLPELLEVLDLTAAFGARGGAWPPAAGRAFRAAAVALGSMARDIAELGIPQQDSPEIVQATALLQASFESESDVVPIAALFGAADPEPIVQRGTPPAPPPPAADFTVELVSLADRLRHAAHQAKEGSGGAARALQLHALALTLRGLTLSPPLRAAAGEFLGRLDQGLLAGRAARAGPAFSDLLRRAADALAAAATSRSTAGLAGALAPLAAGLDALGGAPPEPPVVPIESLAPAPILEEPEVVPIEALAPDADAEVVPIEALAPAPTPEEPEVVPIEALAPAFTPEEPEVVPIEALAPDSDAGAVPIEALFFDPVPAPAPASVWLPFEQTFSTYFRLLRGAAQPAPARIVPDRTRPTEAEPVGIETLLYRGRRALERANHLHGELDRAWRARRDVTGVEGLLAELLDLVPLALDDDR
ncbi:MAG TPA: hypothetical protein VGQ17_12550 [Gemmatimonadales bacterium]|jgi:hypothetical protein|nr:hypothetical protein [Gemmatimonadales bacterium]